MHKTTEPQKDEATPNRSRGRNNIRAATVGGFYASLAVTRPKVSKAGEDPRSPLRHPGRTDVCRSPNSGRIRIPLKCTDYMGGHKTSLDNVKRLKSYKVSPLTAME